MAKLYSALVSLALLLIGGDWARLVHSAKEASKVIQHVSSYSYLNRDYPMGANVWHVMASCNSFSMLWHALNISLLHRVIRTRRSLRHWLSAQLTVSYISTPSYSIGMLSASGARIP